MWGPTRRWLLASAATAVCAAGLIQTGVLAFVQRPTADAVLRVASALPPSAPGGAPDVAVVALDARSMRAFAGDWPWPRTRFAEIVRQLDRAGALAIAFDVDFSTGREPEHDVAFARAMVASDRVVLSAHREFQIVPGVGELEIATLPHPRLRKAAAALGAALVEIDVDGVIRRAFRSREIAGERLPSLAAAALACALGQSSDDPEQASFPIDYRRASPAVPILSAVDVFEGRFAHEAVRGRVVFVGATAAEFQDLWATPLGPNRAGVLIHAWALRTLAAERSGASTLHHPGPWAQTGVALAVALLAAALCAAPRAWRLLGLGGLAAALPAGAIGALAGWGVLLDPVVPLGLVGAHTLLGLEAVRRRLGRHLAERERSLSTLFSVGEATSGSTQSEGQSVNMALALLADVVGASGVGLLRTNDKGEIDGARLEWRRQDGPLVGDEATATCVLADRQTRIFEDRIPGPARESGQAVYTPLFAGPSPVGVLVVEQQIATQLDDLQLRTIATVGTQLALSVENLRLLGNVQSTFRSSIVALASAVEARDGYTEQHCRRLAVFSSMMAEQLELDAAEIEAIELGALLHDVGKIGIRDDVLLKEERLTHLERAEIERHPVIGHHIVRPIHGMSETTIGCVRHHHERWDGSGYPDGLAGEDIQLGARIVAVVDVWDALSTDRPYKAAYPQQKVREILMKDSGVFFEPALVELFFEILDERGDELLGLVASASASGSPS